MPRKRNCNLDLTKKMKALITKRLMQISLIVDEYVYNYKPISPRVAEVYIKEVMGYQDKCTDDKRSLQVIEKLLRCLKGIIEEQNELQALNGNATLVEDVQMDEDITQLIQEIEAIAPVLKETGTNQMAVVQNDVFLTEHVNVPLDLSVNSRNVIQGLRNKKDDIDILHRAISELSIQENYCLPVENNNEAYSQSVLAEFNNNCDAYCYKPTENLDIFQMEFDNGVQATKETELEKGKPSKAFLEKSKDSIEINNKCPETITKSKRNTRKRKLLNVVSLANNIADVRTTEFTADTQQEMITNAVNNKTGRKSRKITRQPTKDSGKVKKQPRKKTNSTKENRNKEELKNKTQVEIAKNTREEKFKAVISPENVLQNFETKITNNGIEKKFSAVHVAPENKMYLDDHQKTSTEKQNMNKQVIINDLSWIKNIRYVREISLEENVPSYYEDDFWNNYYLPNDWDDSEFL